MVILKNNKILYPQIIFQEGHLKSGIFGINSGHRDILSKNGTVPGKNGANGNPILSPPLLSSLPHLLPLPVPQSLLHYDITVQSDASNVLVQ
jgi:hypothetical protein